MCGASSSLPCSTAGITEIVTTMYLAGSLLDLLYPNYAVNVRSNPKAGCDGQKGKDKEMKKEKLTSENGLGLIVAGTEFSNNILLWDAEA